MMNRTFGHGYLPVTRAADALRNQADTIFDELCASVDRAHAFRTKLRAAEAASASPCDKSRPLMKGWDVI